ncbi:hypothetical protein H5V45_17030 [Nocardioides sp. KIGAM211]|uniref:DUF6752 domain-containing protein n=1 Tax=Nocardioides luti TaxID=2761101 RepID=A0A7X0RL63_9ACTN|nr:DUF6752 domain-containing protein [Nocardioides luti]MBB6629033.1 hypothetical protein [Nocardioides luti]
MALRLPLRRSGASDQVAQLEQRVQDLEADLAELRRHHLRLGELADVVQELLVPLASRDEEVVQQAISRYHESL